MAASGKSSEALELAADGKSREVIVAVLPLLEKKPIVTG